MNLKHLLFSLLILFSLAAAGQGRVSVGFYNVENLFDTIKSPFTDDGEYTPDGAKRWTEGRYREKISNIARVLDDMSLDVVGLSEVENASVLRDLAEAAKTDYAYIHLSSHDRRGMDVALFYKGDKFFPDYRPTSGAPVARLIPSGFGREFLYVRGELTGQRVDLVVCHLPSQLNTAAQRTAAMGSLYRFVDSLQRADPAARPIVMGDMNASPSDRLLSKAMHTGRNVMDGAGFLYNPFLKLSKEGLGTYLYDDRWCLYDQIFLSPALLGGGALRYESCGIFIREYLLGTYSRYKRGAPLRTYTQNTYLGGFSDHLPVYVYFTF